MRRHLIALPLAILMTASPALAEEDTPGDLAVEGINRLMQALELFIDAVPLYGAPEILENGDILIPRLNPDQEEEVAPEDNDGQTDT